MTEVLEHPPLEIPAHQMDFTDRDFAVVDISPILR